MECGQAPLGRVRRTEGINWRGRPPTRQEVIVNTIAATTTTTGLTVHAELDTASYPTGVKIPDKKMRELEDNCRLSRHTGHGEWNYTLNPTNARVENGQPIVFGLYPWLSLSMARIERSSVTGHSPGPILQRLLRAPARLYDWGLGWLLGRRFVRLTHVGRRSGRQYQTMLEVIGTGSRPGEVVVLAGLGRSADWFQNLQAHQAVEVAIGRRRFRPVHRILDESEAIATLGDYERRNRWVTPLVRGMLSWLVGWKYDGSESARRRLVDQLPVVAFRPQVDTDVA